MSWRLVLSLSCLMLMAAHAHDGVHPLRAGPDAPMATVTMTHQGSGLPSLIDVQLEPAHAAGRGELFLSFTKGKTHKRQVLQLIGEGRYRLEYIFPEAGSWHVYLRYGAGQAGYLTYRVMNITPRAGAVDTLTVRFTDSFAGDVPPYVQPLDFAVFGLLAVLALASIVTLLRWIHWQTRAAGGWSTASAR